MRKKISTFIATTITIILALSVVLITLFYNYYLFPAEYAFNYLTPHIIEEPLNEYTIIRVNELLKIKLNDKIYLESEIYRDAKENPNFYSFNVSEETLDNAFIVIFGENRYIFSAVYTGGAHCCFDWYIYNLDNEDNLTSIKPYNSTGESIYISERGNVGPDKKDFLVKEGNLYLKTKDDRFSYRCGSFSSTPILDRYFLIKEGSIVLKNSNFKELFSEKAFDAEEEFNNQIAHLNNKEMFCSYLIKITANYIMSGQEDFAWERFGYYQSYILENRLDIITEDKILEIKNIISQNMAKNI